jgi:hypothetical protein
VKSATVDEVGAYEERFRSAGLPMFIEDFRASTDVFNRVVPLLGLVFLGETLNALNLDWSPLANLAAVAGGLAILLVELLRVAAGLVAFAGFYCAIAMLTDSTYREEFLAELTGEMRASFQARSDYLRLRGVGAS